MQKIHIWWFARIGTQMINFSPVWHLSEQKKIMASSERYMKVMALLLFLFQLRDWPTCQFIDPSLAHYVFWGFIRRYMVSTLRTCSWITKLSTKLYFQLPTSLIVWDNTGTKKVEATSTLNKKETKLFMSNFCSICSCNFQRNGYMKWVQFDRGLYFCVNLLKFLMLQ